MTIARITIFSDNWLTASTSMHDKFDGKIQFVQKSMTFSGQNAYPVTANQKQFARSTMFLAC